MFQFSWFRHSKMSLRWYLHRWSFSHFLEGNIYISGKQIQVFRGMLLTDILKHFFFVAANWEKRQEWVWIGLATRRQITTLRGIYGPAGSLSLSATVNSHAFLLARTKRGWMIWMVVARGKSSLQSCFICVTSVWPWLLRYKIMKGRCRILLWMSSKSDNIKVHVSLTENLLCQDHSCCYSQNVTSVFQLWTLLKESFKMF